MFVLKLSGIQIYIGAPKIETIITQIVDYFVSNIGIFSIDPYKIIALPTSR